MGNKGLDIFVYGEAKTTAIYSLIGKVYNETLSKTNAKAMDILTQSQFGITTGIFETTTLNDDGTLHIKANSVAANSGTLVATHKTDNTCYYKDNGKWKLVTDSTTTAKDTNLTIFGTDQLGKSRTSGTAAERGIYAVGAYFVEAQAETPSVIVNTTEDVLNPYVAGKPVASASRIRVTPNPVKDVAELQFDNYELRSMTVYNMAGRKVYSSNRGERNIDVSAWNPGVYVIEAYDKAGKKLMGKIIKQ